jgi:hypothetical protein
MATTTAGETLCHRGSGAAPSGPVLASTVESPKPRSARVSAATARSITAEGCQSGARQRTSLLEPERRVRAAADGV